MSKVNLIEVIDIPSIVEILLIVLKVNEETLLLVILYGAPVPVGSVIDDFIDELTLNTTQVSNCGWFQSWPAVTWQCC